MNWFGAPDYFLSRLVLERAIALVYLIAFVVALNQFPALLGEKGLLPAPRYIARRTFSEAPSLFHWCYSDGLLRAVSFVGMALSVALLVGLPQRAPPYLTLGVWLVLWALYLSIVNVGQTFYAFGWESLLLEAGFLAAFLGSAKNAPPTLVLWLFRWLLFRLEFGAGLIKMRGDPCWRDFTCLYYHHETQPMPNPLSWYFHHLPKALHRMEVRGNHLGQLVLPFFLFAPQPLASFAGIAVLVHQGWLVFSGNFSWLNLLTLSLAFSAIDDRRLSFVLPLHHGPLAPMAVPWMAIVGVVVLAVVVMSYWPARNLMSPNQAMNMSFNAYHLVNTYGAFGSITRKRYEIVVEGTADPTPDDSARWREYEFKGKPGDPMRRPPQFAPYHLRLDWLMWFAAMSSAWSHPWFERLLEKLLVNDEPTLRLMRVNPFPGNPPRFVRALLYRYRFTSREERRKTGAFWTRTLAKEFFPPVRVVPSKSLQHRA
jgi:hypothetical protein